MGSSEFCVAMGAETAESIAERFWNVGMVAITGVYPQAEVEAVAKELYDTVSAEPDRAFGGGPGYGERFDTRVQVWPGHDKPACCKVMESPLLAEITAAICGPDFISNPEYGIFSTPHGCGQGWHQDSGSLNPGEYELNRILYPTTVEEAQGPLCFVPGSHRGGHLPKGGNHEPLPGQELYCPEAGTLVLMHTRCFHRVVPNETHKARSQVNSRVRPTSAPANVCNFAVFRTGTWNFRTHSEWK